MRRFRVECNFGCRYFQDIKKARKYFDKCEAKHLDVELWLVHYGYCPVYKRVLAMQELVFYSGTSLPKC